MKNPYADIKNPYGPDNDFFRKWTKDDLGRNCLVGLSYEESEEYERLSLDWVADRSFPNWRKRTHQEDMADGTRMNELWRRHESARYARLSDPVDEANRLAEFMSRSQK